MRSYPRSDEWLARARAVTPGGAQTRSRMPEQYVEGAYPTFLESGSGCHVMDVDGHGYIDWVLGLASIGLGYCHPAVDAAAHRQIKSGVTFSLPTRLEAELAEQLCAVIPCAESVRFVKSGSEATEAAMRIARLATGRDVILSIGYHGWHSVHDAAKPEHPGVPDALTRVIQDVPYNDLDALKRAMASGWPREIAAVLIEPVLIDPPKPGYLEGVRKLCSDHGAVLIFDEVVTGFRWALGGAQQFFGVTPDLATFGKALANGYPLACVTGRRDLMEAGAWYASSTGGGEAVSLAAALATLQAYEDENAIKQMWAMGILFRVRFNSLALTLGAAFTMDGYPVHPRIRCLIPDADEARLVMSLFLQETAARGLLIHRSGFNVSSAHDPEAVNRSLDACEGALIECQAAIADGDVKGRLRGSPYVERFQRA